MITAIPIDPGFLKQYCQKWKIRELSLFGSILRGDFGPDSDVDVMVTFSEDAVWTIFDCMEMEEEFAQEVGRRVDLFTRASVERSRNWIRRDQVLKTAESVYVEG